MNDNLPACFNTLQTILAVTSGNQIKTITPQTDLVVDLGLDLNVDLAEVVVILNQEYASDEVELDPKQVKTELAAAKPTVIELAKIVQEARELG